MAGPSSLHFNKRLWDVDVEVDVDGVEDEDDVENDRGRGKGKGKNKDKGKGKKKDKEKTDIEDVVHHSDENNVPVNLTGDSVEGTAKSLCGVIVKNIALLQSTAAVY